MVIRDKRPISDAWMNAYNHAVQYHAEHGGNLDVPWNFRCEDGYPLGKWLSEQRYCSRPTAVRHISVEKFEMLDALGIDWGRSVAESWAMSIGYFKAYIQEFGNADVPIDYVTADGYKLGRWVAEQRQRVRGYSMTPMDDARLAELEHLGLDWRNSEEELWERGYRKLQEYVAAGGNVNDISGRFVCEDGFPLGDWLSRQKSRYNGRKGAKLPQDKVLLLDALGFSWKGKKSGPKAKARMPVA